MENIKEYIEHKLNKKVYSLYTKEDALFGPSYFVNDAYVIKEYEKEEIEELSLERINEVYSIVMPLKISEKVLLIDENEKVKITKVLHGDLSYLEEPSVPQVRNIAKKMKKLHKISSPNDIPMDIVSMFYKYKDSSDNKLPKVYENRIVRELNNIKDKIPVALCHNYLIKDNIVYRYDDAYFINFELSNINYTYFDLASYIVENNLSNELKEEFLSTYFGATFNSLKEKRVMIFAKFYQGYMYYFYQYMNKITDKDIYLKLSKEMLEKMNKED